MKTVTDFTLSEWLDYLENRHSEEIQLGLDRVTHVANRLDLLNLEAKTIMVAGTNGKGSTVAALESIYISAGFSVASYTSPHLLSFNERIQVNQQPISDEALCTAFLKIEEARGSTHLTYFEMTFLAALWHIKQSPLDLVILEVGLGGRLDAVNIVDADLAIITTIDYDHQSHLGDTLEEIGYEKAGILRASKPCIYADTNPPASVLNHARFLGAPVYCLGVDFDFKQTKDTLNIVSGKEALFCLPPPPIHVKAAVAAVMTTHYLQSHLPVQPSACYQGILAATIKGRQQIVIKDSVPTLYDVAHNPQAVRLLAEFTQAQKTKGKVYAVFSGLKDKDLCGLIRVMRPYVDIWFPAVLSTKRAASKSMLCEAFQAEGVDISTCFDDPAQAYCAAVTMATSDDLIVVYGSFFMVSAVIVAKQEECV